MELDIYFFLMTNIILHNYEIGIMYDQISLRIDNGG